GQWPREGDPCRTLSAVRSSGVSGPAEGVSICLLRVSEMFVAEIFAFLKKSVILFKVGIFLIY
ncbi:unnamed protein product, partial [Bubo scandiacus]